MSLPDYSINRKKGVSGMMRVKNDAEFIEACVLSCIDALDELVIVYNDCSDESPAIIKNLADKYPYKIRAYEYKPEILAWKLNKEVADEILSGEIEEKYTLAGYYNFALSKTTCEYVMKVDADQIYISSALKELCDYYRTPNTKRVPITSLIILYSVSILLRLSFRIKKYIPFFYNKKIYHLYKKSLPSYIIAKKPDTSMSGINAVIDGDKVFVSLGRTVPGGVNILPPFNGGGDHPIFKVTPKTRFVPSLDPDYNKLNNCGVSVIEKLIGLNFLWVVGPMWIHLNACRRRTYLKSLENIRNFPNSYMELSEFMQTSIKRVFETSDETVFNSAQKPRFRFIALGLTKEFETAIYQKIIPSLRGKLNAKSTD